MSLWRIPRLKKDDNTLMGSKNAASNVNSIAGILTCLALEAERNDLGSMACVLIELANELSDSASVIKILIMYAEKQIENEQKKKG